MGPYLKYIVAFVMICVVGNFIIPAMLAFLIACAVVGAWWFLGDSRKGVSEESQSRTSTTARPSTPPSREGEMLDRFLKINIKLRADGEVDDRVMTAVEGLINRLREVYPRIPSDQFDSVVVKRLRTMAHTAFPDNVDRYIELDGTQRAEQRDRLLESLASWQTRLEQIAGNIENRRALDFEVDLDVESARF